MPSWTGTCSNSKALDISCFSGRREKGRNEGSVLTQCLVNVAQVFRENVWASDIEWRVVRHSKKEKDKIKGYFERMRLLLITGGQKGLAVVTVRQCQNKWV